MALHENTGGIRPALDEQTENLAAVQLPAIMSGVERRMAEARTSGEVLEAMHAAQAALHFAKVVKAANETQADCLRMIIRAEIRMANEVDAAQERGEVQRHGGQLPRDDQSSDIPSIDELGLDRRRLSEWRDMRDAGEDVANDIINERLAEGRAPTKADIRRRATSQQPAPRPTHVVQFSNLIRTLGLVLDDFADAAEAASLCARFDANVSDDVVEEIIEFLAAFSRARNAGQAAR